jgi:AcrR family transcriptional regulator
MPKNKISPRKKQALQTRQKIFDTAIGLFSKRGYEKVTVDDICEKVGVSKGAFYHHFHSKDEILLEQFMRIDSFYRQIEQEFAVLESSTEKLRVLSRKAVELISDFGIKFVREVYRSQLGTNKKVSPLASEKRDVYSIIHNLITEGQEKGEFRADIDAAKRTRTIISCFRGLYVEWCLKNGGFDLAQAGEDLFDSLSNGLRAG